MRGVTYYWWGSPIAQCDVAVSSPSLTISLSHPLNTFELVQSSAYLCVFRLWCVRLVHLLDVYNNIREKKIAGVGNLLSHRLLRERKTKRKRFSRRSKRVHAQAKGRPSLNGWELDKEEERGGIAIE